MGLTHPRLNGFRDEGLSSISKHPSRLAADTALDSGESYSQAGTVRRKAFLKRIRGEE